MDPAATCCSCGQRSACVASADSKKTTFGAAARCPRECHRLMVLVCVRLWTMDSAATPVRRTRFGFQAWNSLSRRWLPKFDLVALWVHDPTELPVLGIVYLLQDVTSFVPKRLKYSGQVCDAIVDHEGRLAWCEVLTISGADGPHGRTLCRIARCIGPGERGASPFLNVDSQVLFVPSSQCDRVVRVEENSSDTCDSLHLSLRSAAKLERTASAPFGCEPAPWFSPGTRVTKQSGDMGDTLAPQSSCWQYEGGLIYS